jgi:hypothetical protein
VRPEPQRRDQGDDLRTSSSLPPARLSFRRVLTEAAFDQVRGFCIPDQNDCGGTDLLWALEDLNL